MSDFTRLLSGLSEVERSEVSKFGVIDGEVVDSGNIRRERYGGEAENPQRLLRLRWRLGNILSRGRCSRFLATMDQREIG
jgi:hypothetical protein